MNGDRIRIFVTNKLPEHTTTHWHRVLLPSDMDGVGGHEPAADQVGPNLRLRKHHEEIRHPIVAPESAFWRQDITRDATRTIDIVMNDAMRLTPDKLDVKLGETVHLHISNDDKIPHEFVLGTQAEIVKHAKMMRKNPEMEIANASSARVATGGTGEIVWQFSKAGNFPYACLIPGHWEAGMRGMVSVAPDQAATTSNAHVIPVRPPWPQAMTDTQAVKNPQGRYRAGQARHLAR